MRPVFSQQYKTELIFFKRKNYPCKPFFFRFLKFVFRKTRCAMKILEDFIHKRKFKKSHKEVKNTFVWACVIQAGLTPKMLREMKAKTL